MEWIKHGKNEWEFKMNPEDWDKLKIDGEVLGELSTQITADVQFTPESINSEEFKKRAREVRGKPFVASLDELTMKVPAMSPYEREVLLMQSKLQEGVLEEILRQMQVPKHIIDPDWVDPTAPQSHTQGEGNGPGRI